MKKVLAFEAVVDDISDRKLSENQKLFLEISLKEYQEIRAELREVIARQNTVLFSSIVQFATLVGLGLTVLSTNFVSNKTLWASVLFCVLIPCITILLGVIWVDLAYRQITMATYIYSIEIQVRRLLHVNGNATESRKALFWECYNHKRTKVDILSYLCSMLVYLILPKLCFWLFYCTYNLGWLTSYYITVAFFAVCFIFICVYGCAILNVYKSRRNLISNR